METKVDVGQCVDYYCACVPEDCQLFVDEQTRPKAEEVFLAKFPLYSET